MYRSTGLLTALTLFCGAASADPLQGTRTVYLQDAGGTVSIAVAEIRFGPDGYTVTMADAPFSDHFLSMRPFKCLDGPERQLCHVPYPYEIRRQVLAEDLTDLEYDFLFLWKAAGDYGINMWNGVYYDMAVDGARVVGQLHEVNLGQLAVPPPPGTLRPLGPDDLEPGDPGSHWLPRLVIE